LLEFNIETQTINKILPTVDPAARKKKSFEPPGLSGHQSWISGAYFYVFGGQSKETTCSSVVYAYNLAYNLWFKLF